MAKRTLNFDKFMREKNNDTIVVNVMGIEIEVKSEIPAIVPIALARAEEGGGQGAAISLFKAADIMFGKEVMDDLCARGMTASELSTLLQKLFAMINGTDETDDNDDDPGILDGETPEEKNPNL